MDYYVENLQFQNDDDNYILKDAEAQDSIENINILIQNINDSIASLNSQITALNDALSSKADSSALTNGSVTKIGTSTVGSTSCPIYLNGGTPTAISSTIGNSSTTPIYSNGGVLTACSAMAPQSHASSSTTYGQGTSSNYGHVKLTDTYTSNGGAASSGVAASGQAVYNVYSALSDMSSALYANTTYSSFDSIPINNYNFMCSVNYKNTGDSSAPDTTSYSDYWWNVICWGLSNRKVQIAFSAFRNRDVLYFRQKHDSNWYGWYKITGSSV